MKMGERLELRGTTFNLIFSGMQPVFGVLLILECQIKDVPVVTQLLLLY
jgi:Na+-transporting methylmalonyl-CoA/oxaloacetate decarboxylase gamma subunit